MKQSTYLETSVIGAYLDNGEPFRRDLTIRWWEHELSEYRAVISPLVVTELERVAEPHRSAYLKLVRNLGHLANVRRQARIRLFNTAAGFFVPMIVTPEFLVSEGTEKEVTI